MPAPVARPYRVPVKPPTVLPNTPTPPSTPLQLSPGRLIVNEADNCGSTPLHCACAMNRRV